MKTIQLTIDAPLLKALDRASRARKTTRSAFIRNAVEAELRKDRVRELERRHAEGYARRPPDKGDYAIWLKQQEWP